MEHKETDAIVIKRLNGSATDRSSKINAFSIFGSCTVIQILARIQLHFLQDKDKHSSPRGSPKDMSYE